MVVVVGGVELGRGTGGIIAEGGLAAVGTAIATNLASAFHVVRSRRSSNISNRLSAWFCVRVLPMGFRLLR